MTASNSPRIARTNTVSAGNGPAMHAASAAGRSSSSSSRPNRPASPACGFSAHNAMRGSAMSNHSRSPVRVTSAASTIARCVSFVGTSRSGMCVVASTTRSGFVAPALGRVAASIIATRRPVSRASISVCPGKSYPPARSAALSSGAVTMPSTCPSSASATARSTARPAKRPAFTADRSSLHEPVASSTSISAPVGPTTTRSAAERTSRAAAAFLTTSGPIPRTSPSVTARRGRPLLTALCWVVRPWLWRFRGRGLIEHHRHEGLFSQSIDVATDASALRQRAAYRLAHLGQCALTTFVRREELRHDELGDVGPFRRSSNLERDDVTRLFLSEAALVGGGQAVAPIRRENARFFATSVVVKLLRQRVERRSLTPHASDAVGQLARPLDVGGVDLRSDENVACFHFASLNAIDTNDVEAVRRLEHGAQLPRGKCGYISRAEQPPLELGELRAATHPSEIAAGLLRLQVHRFAFSDLLEIGAAFDLRENRLGPHARDFFR